jgi:hypothetical protein
LLRFPKSQASIGGERLNGYFVGRFEFFDVAADAAVRYIQDWLNILAPFAVTALKGFPGFAVKAARQERESIHVEIAQRRRETLHFS